jgi:hypothetical protein
MVMTVRDLFEAGMSAAGRPQPANGTPRFQSIVRRQVQSLDWFRVPVRYYDLMAFRPDPPSGLAAMMGREPPRVDAVDREWRWIRAVVEGGHLCPIGIVRTMSNSPWQLTQNHQVLGFAYTAADDGSSFAIRIYDPNHPGDDTVELRASIDPDVVRPERDRVHLSQSSGEPLLGFFVQPYPAPDGIGAWRS